MRLIQDAPIKGKEVLVRVDFNVPLTSSGEIEDDYKIRASIPTIKYLMRAGAKRVILVSHLGRPVIRPKERLELIIAGNRSLILEPIANNLAERLKIKTKIKKQPIKHFTLPAYKISDRLYLLENIRFCLEEERNDRVFAKGLAGLADIYVNDAFAASHREHASVVGVTNYIPAYAGLLIEQETKQLISLFKKPIHPLVLVMGGAKILDKMLALKNLLKKADFILLGGVMANTFLKAQEVDIKLSVYEQDRLTMARELWDSASRKFILPTDFIWDKNKIVDIGPNTITHFERIINRAKTIFWNGTMGLTSLGNRSFRKGTDAMISIMSKSKATTLICGGDTIAEVDRLKMIDRIAFISTGGGATLEFLAGEQLPGLEVLG